MLGTIINTAKCKANGTTGQFVLIEKAKSPEDKKLEPEVEELEFEEELAEIAVDHFFDYGILQGAGGQDEEPFDSDEVDRLLGKSEILTCGFYAIISNYFENGLPQILDEAFVNFLKDEMYGWARYGKAVQPWRENGFVFYDDETIKVVHGNQDGLKNFNRSTIPETGKNVLMYGHSHCVQIYGSDVGGNGKFVNTFDDYNGNSITTVSDAGIPSGQDYLWAEQVQNRINEIKTIEGEAINVLVGEQYITFFNSSGVTDVYDIDTKERLANNISWLDNILKGPNLFISGVYEQGLGAIELDKGTEKIYYDIYGSAMTHEAEEEENKPTLELEYTTPMNIEPKRTLWLMDDERNLYPIETVSGLTPQHSADKYDIDIPDPWIIDEDFNVIKQGAKVLITFPAGRENPVVMGCLQTFGGQVNYPLGSRVGIEALSVKKSSRAIGKCTFEKFEDESGRKENIINGGYSLNVDKGSIYQGTDRTHTIEGEELLNLMSDYIDFGGKPREDYEDEDVLKNKAKEAYLNAKKIFLGFSNLRILQDKQIKIDDTDEIDDPKLQPLAMAYVLVTLLEDLIDKLLAARYIGPNGVSRMVDTDKIAIRLEVKNKLPNMISEITYLLKNPEIVSNES
jgi:hypothetical protein